MKKRIWGIVFCFILSWGWMIDVQASDTETVDDYKNSYMEEIDFGDIQNTLDELKGDEKIDFQKMVAELASGETKFSFSLIKDLVADQLFYEIKYNKSSILHIIIIAVIASIFTNFSNIFKNQQTSEVSFYIIYLLLITILVASFEVMLVSVTDTLSNIVDFTQVLAPAYLLAVAFARGGTTAVTFYNVLIFAIYIVNWLILKFLIPLINIYVILVLVNHLSKEDFLSKLADLIKTIVEWLLKTLMALIIGVNVIQSLLAPVIDSVKTSVVNKAAGAIPGVGGAINAVTEVVLGSAVLIKNGIGVAALIIIMVICAVPVLKLIIFTLMYKFAAAVIQPVSDKRMLGCVSGIGEGANMLLKVLLTTTALFLVTIAIVTASTT